MNKVLEMQAKDPRKLFGVLAIELGFVDDSAIKAYLDSKSRT